MRAHFKWTIALVGAALALTVAPGRSETEPVLGTTLRSAVNCMAAQDWAMDDLRSLGLSTGQVASISALRGSVPGTSPRDPQLLNVVVYSEDRARGWLFFFRLGGGTDVAILRNAYLLIKKSGAWEATEGNGGAATYKAIGRFASTMAKQPPVALTLTPGQGAACQVE